jgi:hypothetical protein
MPNIVAAVIKSLKLNKSAFNNIVLAASQTAKRHKMEYEKQNFLDILDNIDQIW